MRLRRRRSPAGSPQVPKLLPTEHFTGVFVLRLGPGRVLLDLPGANDAPRVASVWLGADPPSWSRAVWPVDARFTQPIAPLDLWPGQVVELSEGSGEEWRACYACVLGVQTTAFVALFVPSASEAVTVATQVHAAWSRAQVESAWSQLQ
jgi:hypothetical protein